MIVPISHLLSLFFFCHPSFAYMSSLDVIRRVCVSGKQKKRKPVSSQTISEIIFEYKIRTKKMKTKCKGGDPKDRMEVEEKKVFLFIVFYEKGVEGILFFRPLSSHRTLRLNFVHTNTHCMCVV